MLFNLWEASCNVMALYKWWWLLLLFIMYFICFIIVMDLDPVVIISPVNTN